MVFVCGRCLVFVCCLCVELWWFVMILGCFGVCFGFALGLLWVAWGVLWVALGCFGFALGCFGLLWVCFGVALGFLAVVFALLFDHGSVFGAVLRRLLCLL